MESGVKLIINNLKMAIKKGVKIRILTGNYLNITQPQALYLLRKELKNKIENCLEQYDDKEKEIKEKNSLDAQKERERAEELVRLEKERERARQDSLAFVQQQKAEEEKKRNIWMIVGGVIFAAVCFVGNQVFQHFRNIRNQRSMFEMQQNIARRAEYEAKRHAYNYTRNKTNEMVNSARKNTQKIVNNKVRQSEGNKPKKFSI